MNAESESKTNQLVAARWDRELIMFGLNPLRVESFQNNVFKVVLLVLLLLFTCGLVTAVAVRFLDSTQTAPTELSLQPERLLGSYKTFKVHLKRLKSFF